MGCLLYAGTSRAQEHPTLLARLRNALAKDKRQAIIQFVAGAAINGLIYKLLGGGGIALIASSVLNLDSDTSDADKERHARNSITEDFIRQHLPDAVHDNKFDPIVFKQVWELLFETEPTVIEQGGSRGTEGQRGEGGSDPGRARGTEGQSEASGADQSEASGADQSEASGARETEDQVTKQAGQHGSDWARKAAANEGQRVVARSGQKPRAAQHVSPIPSAAPPPRITLGAPPQLSGPPRMTPVAPPQESGQPRITLGAPPQLPEPPRMTPVAPPRTVDQGGAGGAHGAVDQGGAGGARGAVDQGAGTYQVVTMTPAAQSPAPEPGQPQAQEIPVVKFGLNERDLSPKAQGDLNKFIAANRDTLSDPNATVNVSGFASRIGDEHYNAQLSQQRADAVAKYLHDDPRVHAKISPFGQVENHWASLGIPEGDNPEHRIAVLSITPAGTAPVQPHAGPDSQAGQWAAQLAGQEAVSQAARAGQQAGEQVAPHAEQAGQWAAQLANEQVALQAGQTVAQLAGEQAAQAGQQAAQAAGGRIAQQVMGSGAQQAGQWAAQLANEQVTQQAGQQAAVQQAAQEGARAAQALEASEQARQTAQQAAQQALMNHLFNH